MSAPPPNRPPGGPPGNQPPGRSRGRAGGTTPQPPQHRPGPPGPNAPPPGRGMPPGPPQRPGPGPGQPPPGRGMPPQRPGPPGAPPSQGGPPTQRPGPPGGPPSGRAQPQMAPQRPGPQAQVPVGAGRSRGQPGQAGLVGQMESLTLSSTSHGSTGTPLQASGDGSQPSKPGSGTGSAVASSAATGLGRGGARGRREAGFIMTTRPEGLASKKGDGGVPFECATNYFKIIQKPAWKLLQYRVDFNPPEDDTRIRKDAIKAHKQTLGRFLFDGTMLVTPQQYSKDPMELTVQHPNSGQMMHIKIRLVGEVMPTDYHFVQFLNILLRTCMEELQLAQLGRNYYDPAAKSLLREYNLELWPGYVTSIRQQENEMMLCCELSTKVLRTDTCLDQFKVALKSNDFKRTITRILLGNIVITRYNNKTYKIDDIDFTDNPSRTFNWKGKETSIADYYKARYNIQIKDLKQPLLVSNPNARQRRAGITEPIKLVPELCNMTGLSDEQRADFKLMKAVSGVTLADPKNRVIQLNKFAKRVTDNPKIKQEFLDWDMKFSGALTHFQGRTLPPEKIIGGQVKGRQCDFTYKSDNADWGALFRNYSLFGPVQCPKFMVMYDQRDSSIVKDFLKMLGTTCIGMNFTVGKPLEVPLQNNRANTYGDELTKQLGQNKVDMVMVVIPNNKSDAYSVVKKICLTRFPTSSQVMTATVLKKPKGIGSVATKVAIQMAAKMGGEPWSLHIPIGDLMIIGYDTWHDASQKGLSIGAVVATTNVSLTRFHSSCTFHRNNEENLQQIKSCIVKALHEYKKVNGKFPGRIIVYRDGVGDGQIPLVKEQEIGEIKKIFVEQKFDAPPAFTYIVVSKRVNSRFFKKAPPAQGDYINPPSGSVFDDVVTLPERYDFYLISQSVRQGSVNPTSYNVIEDTSGWQPKRIQVLTYKLTHLYFNWSGTVRVPMVCQYAHKLAYLIGQSVHAQPHQAMEPLLYYL